MTTCKPTVRNATSGNSGDRIIEAEANISRLNKNLKPFAEWDCKKFLWWDAYQEMKHNRGNEFSLATYRNAVTALSALYILVF